MKLIKLPSVTQVLENPESYISGRHYKTKIGEFNTLHFKTPTGEIILIRYEKNWFISEGEFTKEDLETYLRRIK